jgi:hypothetical protein
MEAALFDAFALHALNLTVDFMRLNIFDSAPPSNVNKPRWHKVQLEQLNDTQAQADSDVQSEINRLCNKHKCSKQKTKHIIWRLSYNDETLLLFAVQLKMIRINFARS